MKNLAIVFAILLLCSCKSKQREPGSGSDRFFEINYEEMLKNQMTIPLSQAASDVEYVKLETNDDCMIRRVGQCFITDSLIFIGNTDHILKFSRDGKFLLKIGSPGRGPGEIDLIRTMTLVPDKKMIAVQKNAIREMMYFSFDGKVIKTVKIPRALYIKVMNNGNFIAYDPGTSGSNINTFSLINETGDTISSVRNYCTWINTSGMVIMAGTFPEPFSYRNNWFFKDRYNDTVYTVVSDKIKPSYMVNMGRYKLPDELRLERLGPNEMQLFKEKAPDYNHTSLFEAEGKLFVVSYCFGNADLKYLLFDKQDKTGKLLINDAGISTGFVNDWDGGMDFWPAGIADANQLYMPANIMTLKNEMEKNTSGKTVRFPEKQKELEKIITNSDISDNPVIMLVTLKN